MFPSLFCVDAIWYNVGVTICISNGKNVIIFGKSEYCSLYNRLINYDINFSTYKEIKNNENTCLLKIINNLINIKSLSCGLRHICCLDYDGNLFTIGRNSEGQLGIGEDIEYSEESQIVKLPPCKQISCGDNYSICLTEDNRLYSFGINIRGNLGLGNNKKYYSSPQLIPDLNNIEFIECGGCHVICKTYNNEFYGWGYNVEGQLGQGNNKSCNKPIQCFNWPNNIINVKSGACYSLLLTEDGEVYSFGSNNSGQLGLNDKNLESINIPILINDIPAMQRIECGDCHSLCIDINDNLWVFGCSICGQLGLGDKENRYKPIQHPTLSNIIDISSGGYHTFVKTIDNKIYAFGYNKQSQIGMESSEENQLTPIQLFEDNEDIWCSTIGKSKQKSARK